jgi:methylmalonyl-CoA/ethylmalonyl-CoA epimerase
LIEDINRNFCIQFGEMGGYRVELVSPLNREYSPLVDGYLGKVEPTPYHICYKSEKIEEEISNLEHPCFKVTVPLAAVVAGKRVVFMMNLGLGLIEIVAK